MFDVHDFPRHRSIGRGFRRPDHTVTLYRNERRVGQLSFPATDTRFVKDRELFEIAFQQIKNREQYKSCNPNDPQEGSWDMFSVSFCFVEMFGNTKGELLERR